LAAPKTTDPKNIKVVLRRIELINDAFNSDVCEVPALRGNTDSSGKLPKGPKDPALDEEKQKLLLKCMEVGDDVRIHRNAVDREDESKFIRQAKPGECPLYNLHGHNQEVEKLFQQLARVV